MWVYLDVDEPTVLQVRELVRQGKFGPAKGRRPPKIPFHLQLANEKGFPHEAILDFVNNEVNQATATLLVLVYFVLAAKYESWRLPLGVILVVPMCLLAAVTGMAIVRLPLDIFVQIGFLVLVALACKNAILIVEYAHEQDQQGAGLHEATEGAARVRFRPIIMTSLAFIGGVFPLVVATGAGAEMRRSLGTAVFRRRSSLGGTCTPPGTTSSSIRGITRTWNGSHGGRPQVGKVDDMLCQAV